MDSLGTAVLPDHIDVVEDPHVPKGKGSAAFDDEGVRTRKRASVVEAGVVQGYFLSSYSARKLGMKTTGHAGGAQNLTLTSRLTRPATPSDAMLRRCTAAVRHRADGPGRQRRHRRLFARRGRLLGRGRPIAFPVQEITIAGNLKQMFRHIVAVGADSYTSGSRTWGRC
jgi:PmbA protein